MNTQPNFPAEIHQLLHGYDRGHRLIAGSTSLADQDLRLVDRLSDAAGSSMATQSDGYLTGYPLSRQRFALAKTWHDRAAPRPNVVWTHTLVLPREATNMEHLVNLQSLFRHPDGADLESFQRSLEIPADRVNGFGGDDFDTSMAFEALGQLYFGPSDNARLLSTGRQKQANDVCMRIWSQQWPRLRRAFSFSTGSSEARHARGRPFDLTISEDLRRTRRSARMEDPRSWALINQLMTDLEHPGEFRDFARQCGSDSSSLSTMAALSVVWDLVISGSSGLSLVSEVATMAPLPGDLRRLKRALLRGRSRLVELSEAPIIVGAVATPEIGQSFLPEDVDIVEWVNAAWSLDPGSVISAIGPHGRHEAESADVAVRVAARSFLFENVAPAQLGTVVMKDRFLAADLVNAHGGETAWRRAVCSLSVSQFSSVVDAIDWSVDAAAEVAEFEFRQDPSFPRWRRLAETRPHQAVGGMLLVGPKVGPAEAAETVGELADGVAVVQELLQVGLPAQSLDVVAELVLRHRRLLDVPPECWSPLADQTRSTQDGVLGLALLLRIGISTSSDLGDSFVSRSLPSVFEALKGSEASREWAMIEPVAPGTAPALDRCRRLADAIALACLGGRGQAPRPLLLKRLEKGASREAVSESLRRLEDAKSEGSKSGSRSALEELLKSFKW